MAPSVGWKAHLSTTLCLRPAWHFVHLLNIMDGTETHSLPNQRRFGALLIFIVISYSIAAIGGLSTAASVKGWYAEIQKPVWTPPNAVFGPVWTFLYGLLAWVGWRFWSAESSTQRTKTLRLFFVQWGLNALWSPVFFGAQAYLGGAIVIVALVLSVVLLMREGLRVDRVAAWSLVPYLVWISYASSLNIGILVLNPS